MIVSFSVIIIYPVGHYSDRTYFLASKEPDIGKISWKKIISQNESNITTNVRKLKQNFGMRAEK